MSRRARTTAPRSPRTRLRGSRGGFALILTLLVLAILVVVVTQFSYTVQVESRIVDNGREDQEMALAARGVLPYLAALFRDDRKNQRTPKDADTLADVWDDPKLPDVRKIKVGEIDLEIRVEDLERRLCLDWLTDDQKHEFTFTALKRLCQKLEIPKAEEVATKIRDKVRELAGKPPVAEGGAGAPAPAPAQPNGQQAAPSRTLLDIEQLLDMEGVDELPIVLYGDPKAQPKPRIGIVGFLTCWSTTSLNLNTMPAELLYAVLPQFNKGKDKDKVELWPKADEIVQKIRERRIDPAREEELQKPTGAQPGGAPGGPPATPGSGTGGGAGVSKSWGGKAFEKVEELADAQIHPSLALLFSEKPLTPGQPAQPATPGPFELKSALSVDSRLYAVLVKATAPSGGVKNVRMVVGRNKADELSPLLVREEPR